MSSHMFKIVIAPDQGQFAEDFTFPRAQGSSLVERIMDCAVEEKIILVKPRELQLFIEYQDVLALELRALIGVQGAMYSTIWSTYVSSLKRVTVDDLEMEMKRNADDRSTAGQFPQSTVATRAASLRVARGEEDDQTGDIE